MNMLVKHPHRCWKRIVHHYCQPQQFDSSCSPLKRFLSASAASGKENGPTYFLNSSISYIPNPQKKNSLGEDASFIAANRFAIGVADGVGSWSELGVDAGKFSRELMQHVTTYFEKEDNIDPKNALIVACEKTLAIGSATACVLTIQGSKLVCANIGDSGFILLRQQASKTTGCDNDSCVLSSDAKPWKLVYQTVEQQHRFNYPKQIGTNCASSPYDSLVIDMPVLPGDLILVATDGLFDNLFINDICAILDSCSKTAKRPICGSEKSEQQATSKHLKTIGDKLSNAALDAALNKTRRSPFQTNANKAGWHHDGGKMDDITIVLGMVVCK